MQPLCTSRSRRRLRRADALRATIDGTEFLLRVFAAEVDSSTRLEVWELPQPVDREKVRPGFELIESSLRVSPERPPALRRRDRTAPTETRRGIAVINTAP